MSWTTLTDTHVQVILSLDFSYRRFNQTFSLHYVFMQQDYVFQLAVVSQEMYPGPNL